jgi:hypothetical protein
VTSVESALRKATADLNAVGVPWALVGGLAVSARATPRFTKDLDFAVAVGNDAEAEDVVRRLRVVASAERLEVLPRLTVPVATTANLIALKVLAGRNQDLTDLGYLIPIASPADLDDAREAVMLIQTRGYNREQDVVADLEQLIANSRPAQI